MGRIHVCDSVLVHPPVMIRVRWAFQCVPRKKEKEKEKEGENSKKKRTDRNSHQKMKKMIQGTGPGCPVTWHQPGSYLSSPRMMTYDDVCWRMLTYETYAHVCSRMHIYCSVTHLSTTGKRSTFLVSTVFSSISSDPQYSWLSVPLGRNRTREG